MKVHVKSFRKLPDGTVELKEERDIGINRNSETKARKKRPRKS